MQSQMVNFRAKPALVTALSDEARRAGVSVSEVIRIAVREKVGLQ